MPASGDRGGQARRRPKPRWRMASSAPRCSTPPTLPDCRIAGAEAGEDFRLPDRLRARPARRRRVRAWCMSASARMASTSRMATSWLRASSTRAGNTWRCVTCGPDGSARILFARGAQHAEGFPARAAGISAHQLRLLSRAPASDPEHDSRAPGHRLRRSLGTPVYAAGAGRISFRGIKGGYGNVIEIDHGSGIQTVYGHLSRFAQP